MEWSTDWTDTPIRRKRRCSTAIELILHTTYITTHSQTPIFCIVSRVNKRYNVYNTPDTGCLECYRPHASVNTTTPKIDRKHVQSMIKKQARNTDTIYTVKIVNKRPCNLLNEIQNVFINGKQVKTAKTKQIIPWFPRFYGTKLPATHSVATGHMREQWPMHGNNAYQRKSEAAANSMTAWK